MRTRGEYERVLRLAKTGLNNCEIARAAGIPRSTVRKWVSDGMPPRMACEPRSQTPTAEMATDAFPWLREHAYAYLLGLYLGDGHLARMRREVYALRIYLDAHYPLIIEEATTAVALTNPTERAAAYPVRDVQMKIVVGYSKSLARPVSSAWSRHQTSSSDHAHRLATRDLRSVPGSAASRADSLRRLPLDQHHPPPEADLSLSALPVQLTAPMTSAGSSASTATRSASTGE